MPNKMPRSDSKHWLVQWRACLFSKFNQWLAPKQLVLEYYWSIPLSVFEAIKTVNALSRETRWPKIVEVNRSLTRFIKKNTDWFSTEITLHAVWAEGSHMRQWVRVRSTKTSSSSCQNGISDTKKDEQWLSHGLLTAVPSSAIPVYLALLLGENPLVGLARDR